VPEVREKRGTRRRDEERGRRERQRGRFMDNVLAGAGKAMGFINDVFGGGEVRETGLWG